MANRKTVDDFHGKRVRVGDSVRRVRRGSDIIPLARRRAQCAIVRVEEIGTGEHLSGLVHVTGQLAWESPANFEKVEKP